MSAAVRCSAPGLAGATIMAGLFGTGGVSFASPQRFHVLDAASDFLKRNIRTQFENFNVLRLHKGLERRELNSARARGAMVPAGERNVVDVESPDTVAQRFQVHGM